MLKKTLDADLSSPPQERPNSSKVFAKSKVEYTAIEDHPVAVEYWVHGDVYHNLRISDVLVFNFKNVFLIFLFAPLVFTTEA